MTTNQKTLLSRYQYDPLDRLTDCESTGQTAARRFYLKDRLTTEIQGPVQRSMFQHDDQLLAQQQHEDGAVETALLATDQQRSVLHLLDAEQTRPLAYTPYGHRPADNGLLSLLGFNGERTDPVTGHYLLGNGYRAFNPGLMRFNSPDSLSPFGEGGLNAYTYCVGDPINRVDPTGHVGNLFKGILNLLKLRTPSATRLNSVSNLPSVAVDMTAQAPRPPALQRYLASNNDWLNDVDIPLSTEPTRYDVSFKAPRRVDRYIKKHEGRNLNLADMARKRVPDSALRTLPEFTKGKLGLTDSSAPPYSSFVTSFKEAGNKHAFLTLYRNENANFNKLPAKLIRAIRRADG